MPKLGSIGRYYNMFDLGSYEFLLVMLVALVVIGPKDLPALLRFAGRWISKGRSVVSQFRLGIDDMVRQTELKDMEKKWADENARIMREFPDDPSSDPSSDPAQYSEASPDTQSPDTQNPDASDIVAQSPDSANKGQDEASKGTGQ